MAGEQLCPLVFWIGILVVHQGACVTHRPPLEPPTATLGPAPPIKCPDEQKPACVKGFQCLIPRCYKGRVLPVCSVMPPTCNAGERECVCKDLLDDDTGKCITTNDCIGKSSLPPKSCPARKELQCVASTCLIPKCRYGQASNLVCQIHNQCSESEKKCACKRGFYLDVQTGDCVTKQECKDTYVCVNRDSKYSPFEYECKSGALELKWNSPNGHYACLCDPETHYRDEQNLCQPKTNCKIHAEKELERFDDSSYVSPRPPCHENEQELCIYPCHEVACVHGDVRPMFVCAALISTDCPLNHVSRRCVCKFDYVRDRKTNKCIKRDECKKITVWMPVYPLNGNPLRRY